MPLANIEKTFMQNLLKPQANDADFLSALLPVGRLSKEKQLSIYRDNINGAHQKVLGQIYPACLNILGEDYFNQLCRVYRFEYPSINADLNEYGQYFSVFINEQIKIHPELSEFEYLIELAWFEWNWHASYYAKDDNRFSFEKLALVSEKDQNKLIFILSDSLSLHASLYPLLDIWRANTNNIEENQVFMLTESKTYFCISRVNFSPEVEMLNHYQHELLSAISQETTLAQLSELSVESNAGNTSGFQNELMHFIQKGWVTDFSVKY